MKTAILKSGKVVVSNDNGVPIKAFPIRLNRISRQESELLQQLRIDLYKFILIESLKDRNMLGTYHFEAYDAINEFLGKSSGKEQRKSLVLRENDIIADDIKIDDSVRNFYNRIEAAMKIINKG